MDRLTSEELHFLFDDETVRKLMSCLKNMVNQRKPSKVQASPKELGSALECLSLACGLVYAVFQFLHLETDTYLLKRMSLNELLRLYAPK